MPTTFTRTIECQRSTLPIKAGALVSRTQGGKPQVRNILATKRIWTEWFIPKRYADSGVATFLANIETWFNTGEQLTVTHKVTAEAINCYIIDREVPEVYGVAMVIGLSITFAEA